MKKIISWVACSFFRQAGRFLFFIVIGGLIFLLIQHNNIQFKWTDLLGIETVKADTITNVSYVDFYNSPTYTTTYAYSNRHQYVTLYTTTNTSLNTIGFYYQDDKRNYDYITFNYLISGTSEMTSTYNNRWYCDPYINQYNGTMYECQYFDSYSSQTETYQKHYKVTMSAYLYSVDGTTSTTACEVYDTYFRCPVINTNTNNWQLIITYNNILDGENYFQSPYFQLSQMITHYSYDANAIINNQNQNQNETMSTITDTNTTTDSDNTATFFNETNTTSESALTSIVSAPISLINNLVVGSHDSICATLNSKQICLPSGDIIWNRTSVGVHDHWFHGGTLEAFISFFNLVVGGFILYKCLLSLFNSVHKLLDPANSWVGVMKL